MSTTNALELLSLPTEILLSVLSFLDGQSIIRFSSTNRAYYNLFNENHTLQSLVQLDICGAEACLGPPNIGPRERLSYMMSRESLWLQISNPPSVTHRRDPGPCTMYSDVDEGVFLCGLASFAPDANFNIAEDELCRAIRALQFSFDPEGNPWKTFAIDEALNETIVHTCLELHAHDLIAIFTLPPLTWVFSFAGFKLRRPYFGALTLCADILLTRYFCYMTLARLHTINTVARLRVHLLQFSTGDPHPLALSPVINLLQIERYRVVPDKISATISGCKIFIHCPRQDSSLSNASNFLIFDWVTGNCLFSLTELANIGHFTLLPDDIVVMSNMSDSHLRFGRLKQSSSGAGWTMQWLNILQLPQASERATYNQITFRFRQKVYEPSSSSTEPQLIFSPSKGLFTIILHMWANHGGQFYLATIHSESLMRCAGVFENSFHHPPDGGVRSVPWSEWGAKYSHFERVHEAWWDKRIDHFGHRQSLLMPRALGHGNELFIRDYNPLSVGYHLSRPSLSNTEELIVGERQCNRCAYFKEDVSSCLPFVQTIGIPRPRSDEHLWMDRDHLVAVYQNVFVDVFVATFK